MGLGKDRMREFADRGGQEGILPSSAAPHLPEDIYEKMNGE